MSEVNYFNPPKPPYGKPRRKIIVDWFNTNPSGKLRINCKYRPQLKDDTDLKYLIKKGFLIQHREPAWRGSGGKGYTTTKLYGYGIPGDRLNISSGRKTYLIKR